MKVARNIALIVIALFVIAVVAVAAGGHSTPSVAPAPIAASASVPAPATPAMATTVATFSGSGQENTPKFTVTDTWKLDYSFNCSSFGYSGNFMVMEDGGYAGVTVNDLAMSKSGSTWGYNDAGTHYLEINSECDWKVKVTDES